MCPFTLIKGCSLLLFTAHFNESSCATDLCAVTARSSARCCAKRSAVRLVVHPASRARSTLSLPLRSKLSN
jgi:hypothetical protein